VIARRLAPAIAVALVAVTCTGCQNPFDPSADLRLIRWFANGDLVVQITQSLAGGSAKSDPLLQSTRMTIGNFSSVPVTLTSYVVVYRQVGAVTGSSPLPAGSPIPVLGGAGGRRYPIQLHVRGLEDNSGLFAQADLDLQIVTNDFLDYIFNNASTINGGIDCEVEVFGTDHNGHDVTVAGALHVEVF
jgi:hypothetical protein